MKQIHSIKTPIFVLLLLALLMGAVPTVSAGGGTVPQYLPKVSLGAPLTSRQTIHAAFGKVEGKDYLYTSTSGTPAVLNIYNLDDRFLVASHLLPGTKNIWQHLVDSKGRVYICSDGLFFKYDPVEDELTSYGKFTQSETASFVMDIDEKDDIYIGTFPTARVVKFDSETETFQDFGQVDSQAQYVRAIAYHNGYVYAGTNGNNQSKLYRIDVNNPANKEHIPIPSVAGYYEASQLAWLYTMNMAGDLLVIYAKEQSLSPMIVYDTAEEKFVDTGFQKSFKGLYSSPVLNQKSYFLSGGKMMALNLQTKKVETTAIEAKGTDTLYGSGWITLEEDEDFPGQSLATIEVSTGVPIVYNPQTNKRKLLSWVKLEEGRFPIQMIENGEEGTLYLGNYGGDEGARYHVHTGEFLKFPIGQTEGSVHYQGKQYFGVYTKAFLYVLDPALPVEQGKNPTSLGRLGENQDRPFTLIGAENKIFAGTIPDYNLHGGALGIYDLETRTMKTVYDLVENQSIMSLAYRDGKVYGSTTIHGGLGSLPVADEAKIFIYDVEKDEKIKEFSPNIPDINKPTFIGSVTFGPDGTLWAVTGNTLFAIDPETEEVSKVKKFSEFPFSRTQHIWRPRYIRFDKRGLLYTNIDGIQVVNTTTMEAVNLTPGSAVHLFTIGSDGNIYYSASSELYKIPVIDKPAAQELEITVPVYGFAPKITQEETIKNHTQIPFRVSPLQTYGVFLITLNDYPGWTPQTYGLILNGREYPAQIDLAKGKFGILLEGLSPGTHLAVPYAQYSDGRIQQTVFGTEQSLAINVPN